MDKHCIGNYLQDINKSDYRILYKFSEFIYLFIDILIYIYISLKTSARGLMQHPCHAKPLREIAMEQYLETFTINGTPAGNKLERGLKLTLMILTKFQSF